MQDETSVTVPQAVPEIEVAPEEIIAAMTVLNDRMIGLAPDEMERIVGDMLKAAKQARLPGLMLASGCRLEKGDAFSDGFALYRCTDIGQRTAIGFRLDLFGFTEADAQGVTFKRTIDLRQDLSRQLGPPYSVPERVFDEDDLDQMRVIPEDDVDAWRSLLPA